MELIDSGMAVVSLRWFAWRGGADACVLPALLAELGLRISAQQVAEHVTGRDRAIEEGAHLIDDGRVDLEAARAFVGAVGRRHALGDHVHRGDDLAQSFASPEPFADGAVAAMAGKAGDHQIADTAQALEGLAAATQRGAEADEFRERPGDQCGLRVIAEAEPIPDPSGDGEDVFQRPAEFDPGDIVVRVGAEKTRRKRLLKPLPDRCLARPENDGSRHLARHFLGMTRPGKHRDGIAGKRFREDFAHAQTTAALDSLGAGK